MQTEIYNKIQIEFPDAVEPMTEDEIQQYYHNSIPDNAWIDRDSKSIMCTLMQDSVHLERKDVKNRITEYEAYYSRNRPYSHPELIQYTKCSYFPHSFRPADSQL